MLIPPPLVAAPMATSSSSTGHPEEERQRDPFPFPFRRISKSKGGKKAPPGSKEEAAGERERGKVYFHFSIKGRKREKGFCVPVFDGREGGREEVVYLSLRSQGE